MDCAEEVSALKRELAPLVGRDDRLVFDILNGKLTVLGESDSPTIIAAVKRAGMSAEIWDDGGRVANKAIARERQMRSLLTFASGVAVLSGFVIQAIHSDSVLGVIGREGAGVVHHIPHVVKVLYSLAIVSGGWLVLPKAWRSLRGLRPDMNLLMTVAVLGAIGIEEWFEAATVTFLFAVSLALESWSVSRAKRAIEALLAITPPSVRIVNDGNETVVSPSDVPVGTRFRVRPGERIPLDGIVLTGGSTVNEAPITGESIPASKEPGSQVFAGSINGEGSIEVESTKLAGETTLAKIILMVGEAHSRRAPSKQWVDRFASIYTPAVFGLAVALAVIPPLLLGGNWSEWLYRSLVLLVIGCPCALVISTPVSIVAGLAAAARNGVLVKSGTHLESPARLRAIAFDKTGTITCGRPSVDTVVPLNGHTESELLERAGAMESHSDHPLARAIMAYLSDRGIRSLHAEDFQLIAGKGASARFSDKSYWLGSHGYMEERGQETEDVHRTLETLSRTGRTVVVVGNDEHVCGFIALADSIRPEAPGVVRELRDDGIAHIVMLTGDNQGAADFIAKEAGIQELHAELLPADKVKIVAGLVEQYTHVAMVGDGINDAPAMGRATLAIAMGAAGSDTAIEAADVALMSDDLNKLPWLIRHSRRTLSVIRQNIGLSLAVKAAFVAFTFLGHASLWAAIAADMGVSLVVISNALRLLPVRA